LKYGKLLFGMMIAVLLCLSAACLDPAAAAEMRSIETVTVSQWDGYMVNNVVIDVEQAVVDEEANNSSDPNNRAMFTIWEWKNDDWSKVGSMTVRCGDNNSENFTAGGAKFNIEVRSVTKSSMSGTVTMIVSSNMSSSEVYYTGVVKEGHANVTGVGKPSVKVTKKVNTSSVSVGDLIEVTVFVENTGSYDALNVTVNDRTQEKFVLMETIINDTKIKTLEQDSNRTVLMYRLKAVEPGTFSLSDTTVSFVNGANQSYSASTSSVPTVTVAAGSVDMPDIHMTNTLNDTQMEAKIGKIKGTLTVRNTGTATAENVRIDLIADGLNITGENLSGNSVFYTSVQPNNDKVIEYTLTADESGSYVVRAEAAYQYPTENGVQTGTQSTDKITITVEDNKAISVASKIPWYVIFIPIILIAAIAFFLWRRRREYRFRSGPSGS